MILRTFPLVGKNPRQNSRVSRFPSKLKGDMEKANDPRSAILTPLFAINL
jgi:hypothetical protein